MKLPLIAAAGHVMEVELDLMFGENNDPVFYFTLRCNKLDFEYSGTGPDVLKVLRLLGAFNKACLD